MSRKQAGVSLMGLIIILIILAMLALLAMKVLPSFMEFRAMKNAIQSIVRERPGATPAEVRKSFESRSQIDDFTSVKSQDLDIQKGSVSFAYRKEVPLWTGVGLYIDYAATATSQ